MKRKVVKPVKPEDELARVRRQLRAARKRIKKLKEQKVIQPTVLTAPKKPVRAAHENNVTSMRPSDSISRFTRAALEGLRDELSDILDRKAS